VTLAFGLVVKIDAWEKNPKEITPPYMFICFSIGNCKAYCYSKESGHVTEITLLDATKQCLSVCVPSAKEEVFFFKDEAELFIWALLYLLLFGPYYISFYLGLIISPFILLCCLLVRIWPDLPLERLKGHTCPTSRLIHSLSRDLFIIDSLSPTYENP
jgi:hypothetical protein